MDGPPKIAERVRTDSELRDRLSLALSLGISEKRLLGWEPATRHHYDEDGRMVASTIDPEWDDTERAKMAAYVEWKAGVGPCGHHHSETVDPEHFFFEWAEFKCPVCAEEERHRRVKAAEEDQWLKQFGEKGPEPSVRRPTDGRVWWAHRIPEDEARARQQRQQQKRG